MTVDDAGGASIDGEGRDKETLSNGDSGGEV